MAVPYSKRIGQLKPHETSAALTSLGFRVKHTHGARNLHRALLNPHWYPISLLQVCETESGDELNRRIDDLPVRRNCAKHGPVDEKCV